MIRRDVMVLLFLFSLPALASEPTLSDSAASRPMDKAEVVKVITTRWPKTLIGPVRRPGP